MATVVQLCLPLLPLMCGFVNGGAGTTRNMREIFIGRCWDYQRIIMKHVHSNGDEKNCNSLWEKFVKPFVNRSPCDIPNDGYTAFLNDCRQPVGPDRSLFWSGTLLVAHEFGNMGRRLVTLEDTLRGYVVNGMTWCGQQDSPGINYKTCPDACTGEHFLNQMYWLESSKNFAKEATGMVTVMLNGSRSIPAFRNDSIFALIELPNLNPEHVTKIRIFVAHDIGKPQIETCDQGSLVNLKEIIKELHPGMIVSCYDNPSEVRHMLCIEAPHASICEFAVAGSANHRPDVYILLVTSFLVFLS